MKLQGNIMDADILVKTIVERVLSQLQAGSAVNNTIDVMVFSPYSKEIADRTLKCMNSSDVELHFWGDGHPNKGMARYIIPQLSCCDMADLASGQATGPLAGAVLQLLLEGTCVEVLEYAYKAYEKTAAPGLYKLYMQHESTLSSFGLTAFKPKVEPINRYWQKLITESDVEQAIHDGVQEMHVPNDSVITPLAIDFAKLAQINIHKKL